MLTLSGNLGQRQRQLNTKVNDAAACNVNFYDVIDETEKSDVDKLFKIDLASKYKNIEYILEVLKSGDELFISRALKSTWLCEDEFSDVINPDYLHIHIFPWMSLKMTKKLLTAVSMSLTNENRAKTFYTYCMSRRLTNIAFKFLIYSPEAFKLHVIEENVESIRLKGAKYLRYFIGNSFIWAERFLKALEEVYRNRELPKLRHLYSVCNTQFLDLFENNAHRYVNYELDLFGLRLSKHIMTKHKDRVLNNPRFYTYFVKEHIIAQYSTKEDVEFYYYELLPDYCSHFFWEDSFWRTKYIIELIPKEERFEFLKQKFHESYPYEKFENSEEFYTYGYYSLFTPDQLEAWALNHLASEEKVKDEDDDYIWYKFVDFETAFEGIQRLLMKIKDLDKRALTIEVLITLAKTKAQLKQVFEYYSEVIVNEPISYSECFINKVKNSNSFDVYDFDEELWSLFTKLCKCEKRCNVVHLCNCSYYHEIIELIYNIINDKEIRKDTRQLTYSLFFSTIRAFMETISKDRSEKVYQYLVQYYIDEVEKLEKQECYEIVKEDSNRYISWILEIMKLYGKTKSDCPEIVLKYVKLDSDWFGDEKLVKEEPEELIEKNLLDFLKQNAELVVDKLPKVKENILYDCRYKLDRLLRKLRTYFSHDIAKKYLDLYLQMLSEPKSHLAYAQAAVYGIFLLADDNFCLEFMLKYVPADFKINRKNYNLNEYRIQQAIRRNACYSRSSIIQSNILNYLKGDYVLFCTPILRAYLIRLPSLLTDNFIKNILEAPLSDPKHSLRLALQCYTIKNLNKLAIDNWNATKDVSLRCFLYKTIFERLQIEDESSQILLFETLKMFTQDLRTDDKEDVFTLLVSNTIPADFLTEYLVEGWNSLMNISDHVTYCTRLIQSLEVNIRKIPEDFSRSVVNAHIKSMIVDEQFRAPCNYEEGEFINAKWEFTANYIAYIRNQEELDEKLKLMNFFMKKCLLLWNDKQNDKYALREFFLYFIEFTLETKSYEQDVQYFSYINDLVRLILNTLLDTLPVREIYPIMWKLRLSIITRDIIMQAKLNLLREDNDEKKLSLLKGVTTDFATALGDLITEFVEKEMYFTYLEREIWVAVVGKTSTLFNYNLDYYKAYGYEYEDVKVLVGVRLIEFETRETYMITAMLLEYTYWTGQCREEYTELVDKLKSLEDKDLKTYVYGKFA